MEEFKTATSGLSQLTETLKQMGIKREAEIRAAEAKRIAEAEEAQRIADEKARKQQEANEKNSRSHGGDGNVKTVEAEQVQVPVSTAGLRSTTRTKSIVDGVAIENAIEEGVRSIEGVRIYQVWDYEVTDAKKVPKKYRRMIRG